jgi:hypothetical protein
MKLLNMQYSASLLLPDIHSTIPSNIFNHCSSIVLEVAGVAQCKAAGNIVALPIDVNTIVYPKCLLCIFTNIIGLNICLLLIQLKCVVLCVFGNVCCHTSCIRPLSKIGIPLIRRKTNNMHLLYLPLYFISTCWLLYVSAVACHHQGAYWILLSYLKNTTEGWYII